MLVGVSSQMARQVGSDSLVAVTIKPTHGSVGGIKRETRAILTKEQVINILLLRFAAYAPGANHRSSATDIAGR